MVFHWSLSNNKSSQVSWTLLNILVDLNNAVVWMASTRPLISKSSSPFTNHLVTVPSVPITIGITVTFMFPSFFSSQARSRYLFLLNYAVVRIASILPLISISSSLFLPFEAVLSFLTITGISVSLTFHSF